MAEGSNSAISHRLSSSSLKHSRATVHVCDSSEKKSENERQLDSNKQCVICSNIATPIYERNCVLTCRVYVDFRDAKSYG